jgi:hypothetical protein
MKTDKDGSLTIYVQKDSPGADKEANWLPAPEGEFFFFLRTYIPGEELVNQTWQPPSVTRVEEQQDEASSARGADHSHSAKGEEVDDD